MNKGVKEFKELLKPVNPERLDEYGLMIFKGINVLLDYINKLEKELAKYKARETALNKLNERIGLNAIHGNVYGKTYDELVEILERGKEC